MFCCFIHDKINSKIRCNENDENVELILTELLDAFSKLSLFYFNQKNQTFFVNLHFFLESYL